MEKAKKVRKVPRVWRESLVSMANQVRLALQALRALGDPREKWETRELMDSLGKKVSPDLMDLMVTSDPLVKRDFRDLPEVSDFRDHPVKRTSDFT